MYLEKLRSQNPLTICITNDVVKNFTANGLLALGASPAMSEYPEDLEDLLPYAKGLLINTGTLTNETWELYKSALDIAGEMAEQKTSLPGTFQIEFINSLYAIQSEEVEENKKVIHYE